MGDIRTRWVLAVGLAVTWGVLAGLLTPRSPQTTVAALVAIAVSLGVGGCGGMLTRSGWAVVVLPVAFVVAVELSRMPVSGPTVDLPHLSTYGVYALVVGRGFHLILTFLPMAVGAAWGVLAARRTDGLDRGTADEPCCAGRP